MLSHVRVCVNRSVILIMKAMTLMTRKKICEQYNVFRDIE
jgi:hypothetical protein